MRPHRRGHRGAIFDKRVMRPRRSSLTRAEWALTIAAALVVSIAAVFVISGVAGESALAIAGISTGVLVLMRTLLRGKSDGARR
jgi:hypothetical protein